MMPLIRKAGDPARYGNLLCRIYGFYAPLEQLLAPFQQAWGIDPQQHQKAHHILADLETLQVKDHPDLCTRMPRIQQPFDALGAWYVLEGAALGGRVIARMIRAHGTIPEDAFRFFDGKETGARWQQFQQLMNRLAATPGQMQRVAHAANDTFNTHTQWMQIQ